jgi:photosystem II stability/assembly factor-like uncharacterized protein
MLWVAGSSRPTPGDLNDRPTIFLSESAGSWEEQTVAVDAKAQLLAIDMRGSTYGLAGGFIMDDSGLEPLVVYTDNGGEVWTLGDSPTDLKGLVIAATVRGDGDSGWAVGNTPDAPGFAMLATTDGGKTWQRRSVVGDDSGRVRAFARSSQGQSS